MKNKKRFFLLLLFVLLACATAYFFFGRSNEEVPHFVTPDELAEKWDGDQELPQETTSPIVMLGRPDNMGTLRAGYYTGTATFRVSLEEKPRS